MKIETVETSMPDKSITGGKTVSLKEEEKYDAYFFVDKQERTINNILVGAKKENKFSKLLKMFTNA